MKRKTPVLCLLAAVLVGLALLAGCGAKAQPVYITVVNRTTLPLADLRIKLVSEEDFGENRLETTLQEGETALIQLGQYTQAQLDGGCNLQFYDETAEPSCFDPDVQSLQEYLTACALSLSDAQNDSLLSAEENEEYSRNLSYPVYVIIYTAGENEDTREWTVFAMDTDLCTYLYGFCASPDAAKDAMETYQSIFSQLYLSDDA